MNDFLNMKNFEVAEKYLQKGRWYVKVTDGEVVRTMPKANYVWLRGNPSFKAIPKGYVIHHLDYDKLNDDISNLSLMAKYHHTAHHWKQKNLTPNIKHMVDFYGMPDREPRIYGIKYKGRVNRYLIEYGIRKDGKTVRLRICSKDGKGFKTEEEARAYINELWPFRYWELASG